jgi:hypothetical protein
MILKFYWLMNWFMVLKLGLCFNEKANVFFLKKILLEKPFKLVIMFNKNFFY